MEWNKINTKYKLLIVAAIIGAESIVMGLDGSKTLTKQTGTQGISDSTPLKEDEKIAPNAVIASSTKENWDDVSYTVMVGNRESILELMAHGEAIQIEKGTRLSFIDSNATSNLIQVRINEGEESGRTCFIPRRYFEENL